MNEFRTYHPFVNFIYFVFVIGFSCVFMHPVSLVVSFVCAFTYSVMLKGRKAVKTNLVCILPIMIMSSVINPVFNHEGVTILGYLPSGNPFTLESAIYGIAAAFMIASVVCWFSCFNKIMTSDKFIYLFGRVAPSFSLVLSMTLRFIPRFSSRIKEVSRAQRGVGRDVSDVGFIKKIKRGLTILSMMVTWSLENSVETADSMKSRGYGLEGRTSFSIFKFDKRDKMILMYILICGAYVIGAGCMGGMYFRYFPSLKWGDLSFYEVSVFVVYTILCIMPILIELWEVRRWNALK